MTPELDRMADADPRIEDVVLIRPGMFADIAVFDPQAVADEVALARRLSAKFDWVQLDVTRRSIEETAAAVMKLYADRQKTRHTE